MFSLENYFSDSSSDEENLNIRKEIRDKSNLFDMPDFMFLRLFRVNKDAFTFILNELKQDFKATARSSSLPNILKLAVALNFFARGSYQESCGQDFNIGFSQSSVSRSISEVVELFEKNLCPRFISFKSEEDQVTTKNAFYNKYLLPGVIGCVDGTHVNIIRPSENEHLFFNRKGHHSLNLMIVCDDKMRILAVDARFGGASHDSSVWNLSEIRKYLQEKRNSGTRNSWLLGDSGYPLEPWLITPYRAATEGSTEARFNTIHSKARCVVERTIGVLKNRFRCLLGARQLHYGPEKAIKIINACCALHNICINFGIDNDMLEHVFPVTDTIEDSVDESSNSNISVEIRNQIMRSVVGHFS